MLLDWIGFLPIMQCIFSRHVFIHYHAQFFLSFFPERFAMFMFSFSSLFSFSFLSIAPKKSVPSWNPISCHHSASSSSSIPLFVHFHNKDAQKDFDKNFSDRAIHSKCQVILFDFPKTPLADAFHSWGWASLCEKLLRCPDVFI